MKKILKLVLVKLISFCVNEILNTAEKRLRFNPLQFYRLMQAYESYKEYAPQLESTLIFPERSELRIFVIERIIKHFGADKLKEMLLLEFGVASGNSLRHFSSLLHLQAPLAMINGFDSFMGLSEDWLGMPSGRKAGAYAVKNIPKFDNNVRLNIGLVEDIVPGFVSNNSSRSIAFAHLDMDIYTPCKFTLKEIKPLLVSGSLLLFDDFYGEGGWKNNDNKAFSEVFSPSEYKFVAFGKYQALVEIL